MNSWNFPNIFKGNGIDITVGKPAVILNLNLLINSELFEFRFDPSYGSNIPLLLFKTISKLNEDLLIDAVYELQNYCPNIRFNRDQVSITFKEPGKATIYIPATIDNENHITDIILYAEAKNG